MYNLSKQVAALSLGLVAVAAPLHAQGAQFSLGGSVAAPLGDFDDAAKMGFHALAGVTLTPATMPVAFQLDGNFAQFSDESALDIKSRMLFATGNVVYKFKTAETSRLHPYLIGGVGVYNSKATGDDALSDESTTDFGVNAGAGFNIMAGAASVFVEGRFHNVFTDPSNMQFIPLTLGVRFGGK